MCHPSMNYWRAGIAPAIASLSETIGSRLLSD
jgi:hypothetical protein